MARLGKAPRAGGYIYAEFGRRYASGYARPGLVRFSIGLVGGALSELIKSRNTRTLAGT